MGSMFVGKVLMAMYEQPAKAVADAELQPIKSGAWAAWAKSYADEHAATPAAPVTDRAANHPTRKLATGSHRG
jgi:hypothetical protein